MSAIPGAVYTVWVVAVGGLGLLMAVLRTTPEEVRSNLSKWLEWAGARHVPAKLRAKSVDRALFRWAACAMAFMALAGWLAVLFAAVSPRPSLLTASLPWKAAFVLLLSASIPLALETRRAIILCRMARALRIRFDPANPGRHFYSLESASMAPCAMEPVVYWEYRVEIENASSVTLRNVRVTSASLGVVGSRPEAMPFDLTKTETADFSPGQAMLVPVLRWPYPAVRPGMLAGPSAEGYGPIEVVVTADGVPALTRRFRLDHRLTPMIRD